MNYSSKIRIIDILAFMACFGTILDAPYINTLGSVMRIIKIAWLLTTLLFEILFLFRRKIHFNLPIVLLLLLSVFLLLSSIIRGNSLTNLLSQLVPIYCVASVIALSKDSYEINGVLKIWCCLLVTVLLIDLLTMIVWPHGLYRSQYYSNNWFLGYKTNRLLYTLPLAVVNVNLSLQEKKKFGIVFFLIAILSLIDAVFSGGTAAAIALTGYYASVLFLYSGFGRKKRGFIHDMARIIASRYMLILTLYVIVFFMLVIIQNSSVIKSIIDSVFHKAKSLDTRSYIWLNAVKSLSGHWLTGLGLQSTQQYVELTRGFFNPHNLILTYVISGGLIGIFLISLVLICVLERSKNDYYILMFIYVFLLLGLNSSTLAFCPYFFALLLLPYTKDIHFTHDELPFGYRVEK